MENQLNFILIVLTENVNEETEAAIIFGKTCRSLW